MENKGVLYLIPTLIAADTVQEVLPVKVVEILRNTRFFYVENIRSARRFISSLQLGIVIDDLHFVLLTETPPDKEEFLDMITQGNIGILSEAGCPAIADPGNQVVALAHRCQVRVVPLTGPSSIVLALMASGFNGQNFIFHGYLPIAEQERKSMIQKIEKNCYQYNQTQLFIETPYRNLSLLKTLLSTCQKNTLLCIASRLTATDEYICTQSIEAWKKENPDINKKETIFLLYRGN
ncbi:MAG: SAM-dependent methyltransferase [Cytophagales bacterium]|nr:MAG: SAM-dependent methyltransferase [Cytophagales bacterium]